MCGINTLERYYIVHLHTRLKWTACSLVGQKKQRAPAVWRLADLVELAQQCGHTDKCIIVRLHYVPHIVVGNCILQDEECFDQYRLVVGALAHKHNVAMLVDLLLHLVTVHTANHPTDHVPCSDTLGVPTAAPIATPLPDSKLVAVLSSCRELGLVAHAHAHVVRPRASIISGTTCPANEAVHNLFTAMLMRHSCLRSSWHRRLVRQGLPAVQAGRAGSAGRQCSLNSL